MRKILVFLFLFSLLSTPSLAADFGASELEDNMPAAASEVLGDIGLGDISAEGIFSRLGEYIKGRVSLELSGIIRPVAATVAAAVLCSLAEGVQLKREIDYVNLTGCLVIALATLGDLSSVSAMGKAALDEMHTFSGLLLPTLCSAAAGAGAVGSAAAKYAASALFMDVLLSVSQRLILPLLGAYTAAVVASAATGDGRLGGAVKLMKWLCKSSLTALVTVFSFYLGISGIASSGADAAAAKAAKALISGFIPVVGKMVSGASESIAAGAGLIRNAVGLFGLGAVLALCAGPFLATGLRYLLFKAASALVGLIAGGRIAALVEGIGEFYGMLMALVGTGAIFMFISILSLIRTVV